MDNAAHIKMPFSPARPFGKQLAWLTCDGVHSFKRAIDLFMHFFSDDIIPIIIQNTTSYACLWAK